MSDLTMLAERGEWDDVRPIEGQLRWAFSSDTSSESLRLQQEFSVTTYRGIGIFCRHRTEWRDVPTVVISP